MVVLLKTERDSEVISRYCYFRYCLRISPKYTMQFPAYRIGGQVELCLIRGYALSEVCLKRGSTVFSWVKASMWWTLEWATSTPPPMGITKIPLTLCTGSWKCCVHVGMTLAACGWSAQFTRVCSVHRWIGGERSTSTDIVILTKWIIDLGHATCPRSIESYSLALSVHPNVMTLMPHLPLIFLMCIW